MTPLMAASKLLDVTVVQALLSSEANPTLETALGDTALHLLWRPVQDARMCDVLKKTSEPKEIPAVRILRELLRYGALPNHVVRRARGQIYPDNPPIFIRIHLSYTTMGLVCSGFLPGCCPYRIEITHS